MPATAGLKSPGRVWEYTPIGSATKAGLRPGVGVGDWDPAGEDEAALLGEIAGKVRTTSLGWRAQAVNAAAKATAAATPKPPFLRSRASVGVCADVLLVNLSKLGTVEGSLPNAAN